MLFASFGTPQQFKKDRKLLFFFGRRPPGAPFDSEVPACPACDAIVPGEVIDRLLLAALPLRRRPIKLVLDSFDGRSVLSAPTVAPLSPVDVGDGCMPLCDDCLDGTCSSP